MTVEDDLRQALAQIGDPAVEWDDVDPDDGLHGRSVRAFARAAVAMSLERTAPQSGAQVAAERAGEHAGKARVAAAGISRHVGYPHSLAAAGIEAVVHALLAIEARLDLIAKVSAR